MIELTRLNGTPIALNSDLIKTCESSPDTMITLVNGEKLIVREDIRKIARRVLEYRARLLAAAVEQVPGISTANVEPIARFASADRVDRMDHMDQWNADSQDSPQSGR
ncbi:MAG TPA: flagellar FlbD family protein [Terracidiphilus sp.]|nr:flagellar FlbD family protein [Terracidiphilus sp.]